MMSRCNKSSTCLSISTCFDGEARRGCCLIGLALPLSVLNFSISIKVSVFKVSVSVLNLPLSVLNFSIKFQGVKIWNSLSEETKSLHRSSFKKTLKRELIQLY